jgi:hypothetical protein
MRAFRPTTPPAKRLAALLAGTLAAAGVLLSSNASDPRPRPPPAPPPIFPEPAPISLAPSIVQAAAGYEDYMARASLVSAAFQSGADVSAALKLGGSYDPRALLRGEIAYAAIVALGDPAYVASVRVYARDDDSRRRMAGLLEADPRYVLSLRGSGGAAGLAVAALMEQGRKLKTEGAAVTQAAYSIQRQSWSSEQVPDRQARLAAAKAGADLAASAPPDVVANLTRASAGFSPTPFNAPPATGPFPPVVVNALAVAALAILGEAGSENAAQVEPLLSERTAANCETLAKLDLYQCLAVAKPYYEDVFCLGSHALSDTGQCVMIDAGAPVPPATETAQTIDAEDAAAKAARGATTHHHATRHR